MDATRSSGSSSGSRHRSKRDIGIVTAADSRERSLGQLHVYDGEGKGKSQAALGVVLRTIGLGICEQRRTRVLLLRFLKGPGRAYDEDAAIEALQQGFPHIRFVPTLETSFWAECMRKSASNFGFRPGIACRFALV